MKGAGTPWAQEFPPAGVVRGFKEWRRDFLHLETRARSPICMQPIENQDKPSLVILFRSKLTSQAGEDYQAMNAEMETLVRQNPGFVDVKSYTAADGERLT